MNDPQTHTASRVILATPRAIFRAFLDPEVLAKWRVPEGMTVHVHDFDARVGGGYRLELIYQDEQATRGKTTPRSDIVRGEFVEIVPDDHIVERIRFQSPDPAFAGTMVLTTSLQPVVDGTKVTFSARDVPTGISPDEHREGMASSLRNLATLLE